MNNMNNFDNLDLILVKKTINKFRLISIDYENKIL